MKQFLQFVAGGAQEGPLANRLADAVEEEKQNPLWRKAYMDMKDYLDIAREEGREEGLKAGREESLKAGREESLKTGREEGLKTGRDEERTPSRNVKEPGKNKKEPGARKSLSGCCRRKLRSLKLRLPGNKTAWYICR